MRCAGKFLTPGFSRGWNVKFRSNSRIYPASPGVEGFSHNSYGLKPSPV